MPNRWITFVKQWASDHNLAYGCALSKPELKAAYNKEYPKAIKLPKGVKKLEESRPPADVKSKMTVRNLAIRIPEDNEADDNDYNSQADTVVMSDSESDNKPPLQKKKGRPQKYKSDEEVYKAKLESNKLKRREARAAKKAAKVAAPVEPVAEKSKSEKNIAYYEAKLKEAQDWKKKHSDAPANLIEKANNNIRKANETIAKLKGAKAAAPRNAAQKVFDNPLLMGLIEQFKPKLSKSLWSDIEDLFVKILEYLDSLYKLENMFGHELTKKRKLLLEKATDTVTNLKENWQRYIMDTYGIKGNIFDNIRGDEDNIGILADILKYNDDGDYSYKKSAFDDEVGDYESFVNKINKQFETYLKHKL